jgi:hypothetical protein
LNALLENKMQCKLEKYNFFLDEIADSHGGDREDESFLECSYV